MKISIIICSYNQAAYLEDAILSVIQQDHPDTELLVIDGGSDDGSTDILDKYASHFHYCVSEPDRGQTHAINKGIDRATGEILGWLNSDDIYLPGCLAKVARAFGRPFQPNVVHGNRVMFDAQGNLNGWRCPGPFTPRTNYYNICSETAFWRGEITREHGERLKEELRFVMDLEWFTRLYVKYGRVRYINDFLGGFRCHEDSKSATMDSVKWEEGPIEWESLLGYGVPESRRRNWEQLWGLTRPAYTLYPAVMKKIFKKPVSIRPDRLS